MLDTLKNVTSSHQSLTNLQMGGWDNRSTAMSKEGQPEVETDEGFS